MKSGDLRHPIYLERPVFTTDDRSNRKKSWVRVNLLPIYASKKDVSGRDFFEAQAHQAQDIVTFGIRWRDDITKKWRIVHHGKPYEIVQINGLGDRRDYMHIKAQMVEAEED